MINEGYDLDTSSFPPGGVWNPHYTYENIHLWEAAAWTDKFSPVCALAQWIEAKNHAQLRHAARQGVFEGRMDGVYDSKTCALTYPDVVAAWHQKGLFYKCTEMGGVCWIAMIPHAVCEGKVKDPRVLLVLDEADYTNPNWAMETVTSYNAYNETAARLGLLALYVVVNGPDRDNRYIDILQELSTIYHLAMDKVYLDVSTVVRAGARLSEVEGFAYKTKDGRVIPDPDESIESIKGIPALDITGRWQNKVSLLYRLIANRKDHPAFNVQRLIHSACGRKMADAMSIENRYSDALDAGLVEHWQNLGLRCERHEKKGEQWLLLAPQSAYEQPEMKLPVMLIFQEVGASNPFSTLIALSCHYEYIDLVAQGQLICIFFALETPDDNDLFMDILQDAADFLPIDLRRVYLTGHSHNGHFASEFMRRHHKAVAAVATLGNAHGLLAPGYSDEVLKVTDAMVEVMSSFDMPLININAITENAFVNYNPGSQGYQNAVESWQRRLRAFNCPMKTCEEITAARKSTDLATRMIGVPNDGSETRLVDGCECYIAEVKNFAGKKRLRLVTLENLLHMPAPQMPALAWDFVRRFARDLETGEVIELY